MEHAKEAAARLGLVVMTPRELLEVRDPKLEALLAYHADKDRDLPHLIAADMEQLSQVMSADVKYVTFTPADAETVEVAKELNPSLLSLFRLRSDNPFPQVSLANLVLWTIGPFSRVVVLEWLISDTPITIVDGAAQPPCDCSKQVLFAQVQPASRAGVQTWRCLRDNYLFAFDIPEDSTWLRGTGLSDEELDTVRICATPAP
ncbi:hypothetical protein JKP88DRAFT_307661 [Tribonema minus]|uniref:Uncharacterized protein n=1 Tax=Tribonema minus TaxID=303371 RepID=A0A835Z557_9STRA|nr:hypothetical protein JKP88DRAFT_307661 [Tribonema minus]